MAFRFENLEIWRDAIAFSEKIYKTTAKFPREEMFALTNQLRRAVISVSANIAEGSGSNSRRDFRNYLNIAIKSLMEIVSLLEIAKRIDYISEEIFMSLRTNAEVLVKRTQAFRNSLKL